MENDKRRFLEEQDWPILIKDLTVFTYSRFRLWNLLYEKGIRGYSPEDIALEAIEAVFTEEWNWDPNKYDLVYYLKYHVISGKVANLARKDEVKSSSTEELTNLDHIVFTEEDELNAKQIVELIRNELKNEQLLRLIFDSLIEGLKRKDICEINHLKIQDYNNAAKRLKSRLLKLENKGTFESVKAK